jgi:hypothetical protein
MVQEGKLFRKGRGYRRISTRSDEDLAIVFKRKEK